MTSLRILICPDSFKGSLSAKAATEAIARGVRRVWPDASIQRIPLADGGEGTVQALVAAVGGELRHQVVTDPLGFPVLAEYGLLEQGRVAIVELAQASGLPLLPLNQRDPTLTSTYGTGELMLAACQAGATEIWIGLGGSATNDGGAGIATALGFELLDDQGVALKPGGLDLRRLARIRTEHRSPLLTGRHFRLLCDVTNPLIGSQGAAAVFAPQKGADPVQVQQLDQALAHFAAIVQRDLGIGIATLPGAGAAGGAGGGLVAFLNASLESGIELIFQQLQFDQQVAACDWVITGEGKFDAQSLMGKVLSGVLTRARSAHKPVLILAGQVDPEVVIMDPGVRIHALTEIAPSTAQALQQAEYFLEELTVRHLGNERAGKNDDP